MISWNQLRAAANRYLVGTMLPALACAAADGATMNHGTFTGDNVTFVDVTEESSDTVLHYRSFSVPEDTLVFDAVNFGVLTAPGPGVDTLSSELEMIIEARSGMTIDTIGFIEQGDYTVLRDGEVRVELNYFWDIVEVDDIGIVPISGDGQVDFVTTTVATGTIWDLSFVIDLADELSAAEQLRGENLGTRVSRVNLRFENSLTATADNALSIAFVKKKQVDGLIVATSVPEPSTYLLLLVACGTCIWRGRYRCAG